MSDIGEGQGCPLCKEGQDLVFQCSIGSEESKMLNNLSDREFFVGVSGGDYPFVLIPFVTGEAKKLKEDFPPYCDGRKYVAFLRSYSDFECGPKTP